MGYYCLLCSNYYACNNMVWGCGNNNQNVVIRAESMPGGETQVPKLLWQEHGSSILFQKRESRVLGLIGSWGLATRISVVAKKKWRKAAVITNKGTAKRQARDFKVIQLEARPRHLVRCWRRVATINRGGAQLQWQNETRSGWMAMAQDGERASSTVVLVWEY